MKISKINIVSVLALTIGMTACNEVGTSTSNKQLQSTTAIGNAITAKCLLKGGVEAITDDLPPVLSKGSMYQAHISLICKNKTIYDVTDDTKFEVNNLGVVSIDKNGVLTAKVKGNTEITYSYNAGDKNLRKISVIDPSIKDLTLYTTHENLYAGSSVQLHVAASFGDGTHTDNLDPQILRWKSSDNSIATVSNGKVELLKKGVVTIEASDENKHSAQLDLSIGDAVLREIEISPAKINVDKIVNDSQQISAVAKYSDNSQDNLDKDSLSCVSSNDKVIKFSKNTNCLLEVSPDAKASDSANITVSYKDKSQTERVVVGDGNITLLKLNLDTENLFPGITPRPYTIMAMAGKASYDVTDNLILDSSDPSVIMIKDNKVHVLKSGVATLSVSFNTSEGKSIKDEKIVTVGSIEINAPDTLPKGTEAPIQVKSIDAKGVIHDRTLDAKIISTDDSVLTVNSDKQLIAKNIGVAQIYVTLPDGSKATKSIKVDAAALKSISITNVPDSIKLGYTASLSVIGTYSDGSKLEIADSKAINWSVTPSEIATISQDGVLKPISIGVVQITAKYLGLVASNSANIDAAEVVNIDIGTDEIHLIGTEIAHPQAKIIFSDGSTSLPRMIDVNCEISDANDNVRVGGWCSLAARVVPSVSSVVISYQGFTKTFQIKVFKDELPPAKTIKIGGDFYGFMIGQSRQYKLTLVSNVSQEIDVTKRLKLISSNDKILKVINNGNENVLQALSDGYVTLSTIYDGKTYDLGFVTVKKDTVVNATISLYDDANKLADNQHLMPHMEYTIKVTGCTTNTGRVLPSSECNLSLDEKPSGAAANLTGMKFTPLLAGDVVLHDNKYNYDYKYHTDPIRNPHYEMSAGSFSKPFTKIIISDAKAGSSYTVLPYDLKNKATPADVIVKDLEKEGRYNIYDGNSFVTGGGAHWNDIFFKETNRAIKVPYYISDGSFTSFSEYICNPRYGTWNDGSRFTSAQFSSVSVTNAEQTSDCYTLDGRSHWEMHHAITHNSDAIRVYK